MYIEKNKKSFYFLKKTSFFLFGVCEIENCGKLFFVNFLCKKKRVTNFKLVTL